MSVNRRVIVTGSRRLADPRPVWAELDAYTANLEPDDQVTIVHGACRTGADQAAHDWWKQSCEAPSLARAEAAPWPPESGDVRVVQPRIRWRGNGPIVGIQSYPAAWDTCTPECVHPTRRLGNGREYCPQAGPRRNAAMIAAGADFLLAFPLRPPR